MNEEKGIYLRKRENGFYYLGKRDNKTGKIVWISLKTKLKSEALQRYAGRNRWDEQREELKADTKDYCPSLLLYRSFFTSNLKSVVSPKTLETYLTAYNNFLASYRKFKNENDLLREVDVNACQLWVKDMKDAKMANRSINNYIRFLKTLFNRAVKWNHIKTNPFEGIEYLKEKSEPREFLTKDDFKKLIDKTDSELYRDVFTFAAYTGCRAGEIINLKVDSVDFTTNQIHVKSTDSFDTKSGKNRIVPMTDSVKQVLKRRLANQIALSDYVFNKNGYKMSVDMLNRNFKEYCNKAEIGKDITFHNLRHTAASWMIMANVDISTIKDILGHSSTALIDKVYGHLTQSHRLQQIQKIEGLA